MASCMAHVYHGAPADDRLESQPVGHRDARRCDEAAATVEPERGILGPDLQVERVHAERAQLGAEQAERRTARALAARCRVDPQLGEERIAPGELEVVAERDDRIADDRAVALDEPYPTDA